MVIADRQAAVNVFWTRYGGFNQLEAWQIVRQLFRDELSKMIIADHLPLTIDNGFGHRIYRRAAFKLNGLSDQIGLPIWIDNRNLARNGSIEFVIAHAAGIKGVFGIWQAILRRLGMIRLN